MAVKVIRFNAPVNASEITAEAKCKVALEALGDSVSWFVFAGLASSSSPLYQSDDLDLVPIGPRGVFLIEVKHWDAAWINDNRVSAETEAEKLTTKAKRFSGRVKRVLSEGPKVTQSFLVTREPVGSSLPSSIRGVPVWTLRELTKIFRELPKGVLNESQVKLLAGTLEPAAKIQVDGKMRRIASYQNLELQTPNEQAFHRIYKGTHQRTKERVILHLYDLSASEEKNPERQAERESRALQMLQATRFVPRVRDTLRELPEYPGELSYFTLIDPGAANLTARAVDVSWTTTERIEFAANTCIALHEIHGLTDPEAVKIVHRNLCPKSVLVGSRNEPVFINFSLSRLPNTQTLGGGEPTNSEFGAPEVRTNGLTAASQLSDVFSLCSALLTLFANASDAKAEKARNALLLGCAETPDSRASLKDIATALHDCLAAATVPKLPFEPPAEDEIPSSEYWSEGQLLPFRDMTLRIVSRLGSGGVGRTYKVEQVDQLSGENYGTFVAKVMKSQDSGCAALQAYQRVRSHTTSPGLSVVFETAKNWQEHRIVALLKWIEGDSLDSLAGVLAIAAEEAGDDSIEKMLIRCCTEVCHSLSALHTQGLVHGDVSPRNLICDRGGLTLTDYDLVTTVGKQSWGVGATAYCSPEAQRREPLDPSDDFFALAASLFEVAFNHPAFPSPHGAMDKGHGLDWRVGERESLPKLAAFLDQATHPERAHRFNDAKVAISVLAPLSGFPVTPGESVTVPEVVQRSRQEVEWLNSLMRIYPGSPHGNIETRGLDSNFALATYVETPLEEALFNSLRERKTRLVILCGNAGDGKTALLQHIAVKFGIQHHLSATRIWEATTADGLILRANLDGAASWNGRSANELLDEFFLPFHAGAPAEDVAHLLAINDGRLYDWLETRERLSGASPLTSSLRSFLSHDDEDDVTPGYVQFISLNHRSLVGGRTPSGVWSEDFLNRLIHRLLGGEMASAIWSPCLKCEVWDRCTAGPNAHRLLADSATPQGQLGQRLRSRLSDALQAVHQRGQIHITTRELRGVLGYVLFGVHSCAELHQNPGLKPGSLWDMLFAPESLFRQGELLRELASLDPALESHPQLDRWLMGRTAREVPGAGPGYPGLWRDSARRRAFIEWSEQQLEALTGDSNALPLANGDHLRLFKEATLKSAAANTDLCARLCRGISQLESLPLLALARNSIVPLRITPRTPTETYFWVEKPLDRFHLEAEWPRIYDVPLPVLPRRLNLVYRSVNGREDVLSMGYELFHTLLALALGEQLSELRSDDLFANLAIFTQRLAKEDEGHLLAWNPKSDSTLYRLGIRRTVSCQILTCEPLPPLSL
jgi:serine/threonine protein kinase